MLDELTSFLSAYDYETDPVLVQYLHDIDAASARPADWPAHVFWQQMADHQHRVARDVAAFMIHLGYAPQAANNVKAALDHHDWGKADPRYLQQRDDIWWLEGRPTREQREIKKLHARFGADRLDALAERISPLRGHRHLAVRRAVTLLSS